MQFSAFLRADPLTATREDLAVWLSSRDLAPESRRAYRSHLRGFYRWCVDEGLLERSPAERIPPVKVPPRLPRPVSEEELAMALRHADPRMRAWLLLMAYGGLRCLEVAALCPQDVHPGPPIVFRLRVTKGGAEAVVPAHPSVLESLAELPVRDGLWWTCSAHHVSRTTSCYLRGIGLDATAHRLRHFAGSSWYRASGNDLLVTAQLLRHGSVRTTQGYAAISPERAAQVVSSLSPVA
jgi:integrase